MNVAVIIPTKGDRPEMIKEAILSVENQTIKPFEFSVVEGEDMEKLNKAIKNSKSDAFIVLSDDDKLEPNFIEETVNKSIKDDVHIVSTAISCFGEMATGSDVGVHLPERFPFFTSLCKKDIWDKVGGFDMSIGPMLDIEFWYRCIKAGGRWAITDKTFYHYRKHKGQGSVTVDWEESRNNMLKKHPEYIF